MRKSQMSCATSIESRNLGEVRRLGLAAVEEALRDPSAVMPHKTDKSDLSDAARPEPSTGAIWLAEQLIELSADNYTKRAAERLLSSLHLSPMAHILARVPGESVSARARLLGVSRQTYYGWLNGRWRPNIQQAKKIAEVTGIPAGEIRPER